MENENTFSAENATVIPNQAAATEPAAPATNPVTTPRKEKTMADENVKKAVDAMKLAERQKELAQKAHLAKVIGKLYKNKKPIQQGHGSR
jgi:hypothetical protein